MRDDLYDLMVEGYVESLRMGKDCPIGFKLDAIFEKSMILCAEALGIEDEEFVKLSNRAYELADNIIRD